MSIEGGPAPKKIPQMTTEELDALASYGTRADGKNVTDVDFQERLASMGIKLNSGDVEIEVDGEKKKMVTDQHDFGTILDES